MSDQTEIVLDEAARARTMRNRAKFMARSKVQQKLILKRIKKEALTLLLGAFAKSKGCKRFGPRKIRSTCRTLLPKLEKVRVRYMNLFSKNELEWNTLLNGISRSKGLPSCF
jgi:hypothetical protein